MSFIKLLHTADNSLKKEFISRMPTPNLPFSAMCMHTFDVNTLINGRILWLFYVPSRTVKM